MAEKHLIAAIEKRFKALKRHDRIAAVRRMASDLAEDEAFVRDFFPALYREAFLNLATRWVRARDQASGVREPQRLARGKPPTILPIRPPSFVSSRCGFSPAIAGIAADAFPGKTSNNQTSGPE